MNKMYEKKALKSFGKISKIWGYGEPVGRVWGFLLLRAKPLSQKEIEKGVKYSRGLVSRSLKKLNKLGLIKIQKKGKEFYYSTKTSFVNGFNNFIFHFLDKEIESTINNLYKDLKKIKDKKIKRNILCAIEEYDNLKKGIKLFSDSLTKSDLSVKNGG